MAKITITVEHADGSTEKLETENVSKDLNELVEFLQKQIGK